MPVLAFNHFNLRAPQPLVDELRDFYVAVLGLEVGWRPPFDFPGYWLYLGEQAVLHLVDTGPGTAPAHSGTYDHIAFSCEGFDSFGKRLRELGISHRSAGVPGTSQRQIFVTDPAGNGVELNFQKG